MFRAIFLAGLTAMSSPVLASPPPTLSAPRLMPGDTSTQRRRAAAQVGHLQGGDQFLVVWEDRHPRSPTSRGSRANRTSWASARRVGPADRRDAVTISRNFGYQRRPEVVWTGQSWVVAWENQSPTAGYYESRIMAARVSTGGEVIGAPFEPFPTNAGNDFHMASNGSSVVFVTQSYAAGEGGLLARQMNPDGSFVGGTTVLAPETYYLYFFVDIQSAGGEYSSPKRGHRPGGARFVNASPSEVGEHPGAVHRLNGSQYLRLRGRSVRQHAAGVADERGWLSRCAGWDAAARSIQARPVGRCGTAMAFGGWRTRRRGTGCRSA